MAVRAKFKCTETAIRTDGSKVTLEPVTGGSPENEKFFRYTPWGKIEIGTVNREAAELFVPGREYYVDFTPAEN